MAQHAGEVYEDVERIWHNCHSFNEPDSDIYAAASEAQQAFHAKWQQQGLPQHEVKPDKKKNSRPSKQAAAAAEAEAKAAGKGGKKQSKVKQEEDAVGRGKAAGSDRGRKSKHEENDVLPSTSARKAPARGGTEKSASKGRGSDARADLPAQQQSSKRKRGHSSVDDGELDASLTMKSKGIVAQQEIAPEKMSASARLRKGLPPTPSTRISPRMATGEAAASETNQDAGPVSEGGVKGKGKASRQGQIGNADLQVKSDPVSRRTSGRLK